MPQWIKNLINQLQMKPIRSGSVDDEESFRLSHVFQILKNKGWWYIAILCVLFYSAVFPFIKYATDLMVNKFHVSEKLAGNIPAGMLVSGPQWRIIISGLAPFLLGTSHFVCPCPLFTNLTSFSFTATTPDKTSDQSRSSILRPYFSATGFPQPTQITLLNPSV